MLWKEDGGGRWGGEELFKFSFFLVKICLNNFTSFWSWIWSEFRLHIYLRKVFQIWETKNFCSDFGAKSLRQFYGEANLGSRWKSCILGRFLRCQRWWKTFSGRPLKASPANPRTYIIGSKLEMIFFQN